MSAVLTLLIAFSVCCASPALARKGDTWLGVQAGGSAFTGDVQNWIGPGFEAGLELTHMDTRLAGMGVEVAYHNWSEIGDLDSGVPRLFGYGWRYRLRSIQTTAHVLVEFPSGGGVRPFGKFGGGLYWMQPKIITPWGDISETSERLGYNAGAGLNFGIDPAHDLRIAGTFHTVQLDGKHWEEFFTVGVSLHEKVRGAR